MRPRAPEHLTAIDLANGSEQDYWTRPHPGLLPRDTLVVLDRFRELRQGHSRLLPQPAEQLAITVYRLGRVRHPLPLYRTASRPDRQYADYPE